MKRFYREVTISGDAANGWRVLLDGKPMRTPAKHVLVTPNPFLAELVAAEWAGQGEELAPSSMRVTRLVTTVIDLMPDRREPAIEQVLDYLGTDLLCYRAASPSDLVARQAEQWQPWLDWLERAHDVRLAASQGVLPHEPPEDALPRLRAGIDRLDPWQLVALHAGTTGTGSLVLGLAILDGELSAAAASDATLLDEMYSMEQWGTDAEMLRRHQNLRADLDALGQFVGALRASSPDR